jgi:hypothetical protein
MSTGLFSQRSSFETGIAAVADAFAGTVHSVVVSMKNHNRVRFIAHWGVGTTGTSTFTVEACDDTTPSNTTAVAFYYRITVKGAAPGAITACASTGLLSTAGSNQTYEFEVPAENIASLGYGYVRLTAVESVASARLGGVLIEMLEPRFPNATQTISTT